jgi:hypothetical protein
MIEAAAMSNYDSWPPSTSPFFHSRPIEHTDGSDRSWSEQLEFDVCLLAPLDGSG